MRFSRFFVCFFLLISLTGFQGTSSYQNELEVLERQAMDCKEQQAAQVSQSLQEIRKEILKDMESVLNKADLNDIELKELKEKKKVTHRSYERLKKQMALYLMQELSMYPYCLEGRISNKGKDLQTLYMHQNNWKKNVLKKRRKKLNSSWKFKIFKRMISVLTKHRTPSRSDFNVPMDLIRLFMANIIHKRRFRDYKIFRYLALYILQRMIHTFPVWRRMLPLLLQVHIGEKYRIKVIYRPEHGRIRTEECI